MRRTHRMTLETPPAARVNGTEKIRNEWAGFFLLLAVFLFLQRKPGPLIINRIANLPFADFYPALSTPAQDTITRALYLLTDGEPNGGHPNPAPAPDRSPQIQLPLHGLQRAIRGGEGEGVGGGDGDGEAGRQGGAQPGRVPPLRARRPPVAQVGVRAEQVPVDVLGQGDVLPAAGEGQGVPGWRGGVRGDRGGGPGGVPQGDELHLGRGRGRRQALQVRVGL